MCIPMNTVKKVSMAAASPRIGLKYLQEATGRDPVPEPVPLTPAEERANAEAEAAQRVNARLAADQRRRRGQGSLLATGAPSFTMGDSGSDGASPLGAGGAFTTRSTTAKRAASMISQGAASAGSGYGGYRGGRFTDGVEP